MELRDPPEGVMLSGEGRGGGVRRRDGDDASLLRKKLRGRVVDSAIEVFISGCVKNTMLVRWSLGAAASSSSSIAYFANSSLSPKNLTTLARSFLDW